MSGSKAFLVQFFLCFLFSLTAVGGGGLPEGRVVWWGQDLTWSPHDRHTNGVLEFGNEMLTNVVAIAAGAHEGLAVTRDGTIVRFGFGYPTLDQMPFGLSNLASISIFINSTWAIKGNGSLAILGTEASHEEFLAGLRNITSVAFIGAAGYVALKSDGTLLGLSLRGPPVHGIPDEVDRAYPVRSNARLLENVNAIAGVIDALIVLKKDGTVVGLTSPPFDFSSEQPVMEKGNPLSNVASLVSSQLGVLAVKSNGTVVGFDKDLIVKQVVPEGLSNVTAVAIGESLSIALKKDGTVMAWGDNYAGQASVPVGLSNVVAVASGGNFGLALTTGKPPPSVYIIPHGSLEIMERDAEVIFKGLAIRSVPITNTGLIVTNMEPHETTFKVVSRIKGNEHESEIRLQHYSRPMTSGGGGPGPPANYQFEPGNNYIVFAYSLDKEDGWYRPTTNASSSAGLYRQFAGYPTVTEELWGSSDQGAMRALDGSDLRGSGIKEVHWFELNRLLNDSRASYQLYAIKHLDTMSQPARTNSAWGHSDDFKRSAVLEALAPLIASQKEEVARRAIRCFATDSNAAVQLAPFATALVKVANESPFPSCRYAAIAALSGEWGSAVSNSVAQLVSSTNEEVRLCAMTLLPRFPQEFSETLLRELANDKSPYIRSVVADVVAAAKYSNSIPIIAALFADSAGVTSQARGLPRDAIRFNLQSDSCGDVRQSAGVALLAFDTSRTGGILKSNLNDPAFHVQFLAKLAEHDAEPWLKELVDVLESRIKHMEDKEKLPADDPERYSGGDNILQIPYLSCWEDLRRYLLKLPSEKLVAGPQLQYVDLLERCVRPDPHCPGCSAEQVHGLYELYKEKGLSNRSDAIRNQFKNEAWWFDDYDKRH